MFEITPRRLYWIGAITFSIVFLSQCYQIWVAWSMLIWAARISAIASAAFSIGMAGMFEYLLRNDPSQVSETTELVNAETIDDAIKAVKDGKRKSK